MNDTNTKALDQGIADAGQRRRILWSVCIALMAVIASVTGLNVAQPHLATSLNASHSEVLWIINIYAVTLSALLLPLGAVGDRWGRKAVLYLGLVIFASANLTSALAEHTLVMLVARFFTGVGAAMIMPVTLSVITSTFPDNERSKAIGIWTAVAGGGGILGMFLSAILVDTIGWRWLFALPIVLVIASGILGARTIPNALKSTVHRFDVVGAVLSIIAVVSLVMFLHDGVEKGWLNINSFTWLVLGVAASVAFLIVETRHPEPLLDIALFKQINLTSGSITILVWFGVQAGVFIILYPFFQMVLGWSGLLATLGLMPMALLMMVSSGLAPKLSARYGLRITMLIGIATGSAGLAVIASIVSATGGYLTILPGMLLMGLGMGLSMTPSTEMITSSLPQEEQGVASALNDVTREFGTALGVALLGAVFTSGYSQGMSEVLATLPANVAVLSEGGLANVLQITTDLYPDADGLIQTAKETFLQSWKGAMWAGSVVMVILFVFSFALSVKRNEPATKTTPSV